MLSLRTQSLTKADFELAPHIATHTLVLFPCFLLLLDLNYFVCWMQSLAREDIELAPRPAAAATQGKAVQLTTNFFRANFKNVPPILHHDVRVERLRYNPETGARSAQKCSLTSLMMWWWMWVCMGRCKLYAESGPCYVSMVVQMRGGRSATAQACAAAVLRTLVHIAVVVMTHWAHGRCRVSGIELLKSVSCLPAAVCWAPCTPRRSSFRAFC